MRISKRSNIATRFLMYCAANPERKVTNRDAAADLDVSATHLAQIVNKLSQMGYIDTQRGRGGGVMLARPAEQISVGAVVRDIGLTLGDQPFVGLDTNALPTEDVIRLKEAMESAAEAFYQQLDKVSLASLLDEDAQNSPDPRSTASTKVDPDSTSL